MLEAFEHVDSLKKSVGWFHFLLVDIFLICWFEPFILYPRNQDGGSKQIMRNQIRSTFQVLQLISPGSIGIYN